MRIGYTGWTWFLNEVTDPSTYATNYKKYFEQFLLEVSNLGYETVENSVFWQTTIRARKMSCWSR